MKRWVVAACMIGLVGCVHASTPHASTAPTTGVRGNIVYGRDCRDAVAGSHCSDLPWKNGLVQAWTASGKAVGSARTDHTGRFLLPLPPGTYTIIPSTAEGPVTAGRPVTITSGSFVRVALRVPS